MTVEELIRELESMPQNVPVYAEGELVDKVVMEKLSRRYMCADIQSVGR